MTDERGHWLTFNGEIYNYPELRAEIGAERLPHRPPTPRSCCARTTAGAPTALEPAARACSPTRCGTSRPDELFCARDRFGIKPFYYADGRRRLLLRVGGQGAAAVPALDRDRPRRAQGLPGLPVLPGRQDAVQGRRASCCRATVLRARPRPRASPSATGRSTTTSTSTTPAATSRSSSRQLLARVGRAAPAQRRARSAPTCQRRPRLEHRRLAGQRSDGGGRCTASPASSPRTSATTRAATRAPLAECARLRAARGRHRRRRLRRTTSRNVDLPPRLSRSPAPARSRSTWCRRRRAAHVQGGPRRPGRRRDLRRLHPLPRSPTSSSASGRRSTARCTTATSSSPTSRSSPTSSRCGTTSRCSRSSGARGCSRTSTRATSA